MVRGRARWGYRTVASTVAVLVLVAGCRSDGGELDLDGGDGATDTSGPAVPPAADAPTRPPADDAGADGDDATEDGDELTAEELEELIGPPTYPELPLDPDPDSDIPVEAQEQFLELHRQFHEVTQEAFHTGEFDEDTLALVMYGDLFDATVADLREQRANGYVVRSPDSEITWARVASIDDQVATVEHCIVIGPLTNNFDVRTGEAVDERGPAPVGVRYQLVYEAVEAGDGVDFRATVLTTDPDGEDCGD